VRKMLVTGGAGFIGSNFIRSLLSDGSEYEITVLDALTYAGNKENLKPVLDRIEFIVGDICDYKLVDALVAQNDIIVNFAAETHVDNSLAESSPFIQTNILGVHAILEAVRRHNKRLHHLSTDEVFGDLPIETSEKFTEGRAYNPSNPYSASKASGDMLVRAWVRSYGIKATISNSANTYGPYQYVEKLIPRHITDVLINQSPKLHGNGRNVREWTHVDDYNAAVRRILEDGRLGETYLIGSGAELSNKEVMQLILKSLGKPITEFKVVPDRPGNDLRYSNDSTKLRTELGWKPRYSKFEDGLAMTIEWYKQNKEWWLHQKTLSEQRYKRLGIER